MLFNVEVDILAKTIHRRFLKLTKHRRVTRAVIISALVKESQTPVIPKREESSRTEGMMAIIPLVTEIINPFDGRSVELK